MPISYTIPQFINQQDEAPPHFHHDVRAYLNDTLPHRWIGRASQDYSPPLPWLPRSPDLTMWWGYVKYHVFVLPMPLDLSELRQRIEHAVACIDHLMLIRVWQELDYRIDVCRVTNGGHMEQLSGIYRNFERYSILWHKYLLHVCHGYRSTDSRNPGGTFNLPCIYV